MLKGFQMYYFIKNVDLFSLVMVHSHCDSDEFTSRGKGRDQLIELGWFKCLIADLDYFSDILMFS